MTILETSILSDINSLLENPVPPSKQGKRGKDKRKRTRKKTHPASGTISFRIELTISQAFKEQGDWAGLLREFVKNRVASTQEASRQPYNCRHELLPFKLPK